MATKKEIEKQEQHQATVIGAFISLWFGGKIKDRASCEKSFHLQPHAAVCLLLMTTKTRAASDSIASQLSQFGLNVLERVESRIFVEYGMESLMEAGYVKLDAQGKKEYELARELREYGSSGVHWTLTKAGAKLAAPSYCANIGKPSDFQKQAVEDMLAANKAEIQRGRKNKLSQEDKDAIVASVAAGKKLAKEFIANMKTTKQKIAK